MKRRFDKYFWGQLACVVFFGIVMGCLFRHAFAETVSITVDAPTQAITVQTQSTVVTPEVVTVTAEVNLTGTSVTEIAVPGPQGIPGSGTAGEGGGGTWGSIIGNLPDQADLQTALDTKAGHHQNVTFGNLSAAKYKAGNWSMTSTGLTYPNGIYQPTALDSTSLRLANSNIATLYGYSYITSNVDLTIKDAASGFVKWGSVANHLTAPANAHPATAISGLATVATTGSYPDLLNQPPFTRGYDGREIELQTSATHVQWRFVGDTAWTDLIALTAITGANGSNGSNGTDGKTYSCAITGGIRSILYDLNGINPAPTMVAFGVELRENGSVVTPASYTWSVPSTGSLLSGSGSGATFTPTVNGTFSAGSADNRVDVVMTYSGITCRATAPVPVTKVGATGSAGSPDTKQQIYTKINVATTGDVLNTQAGAGDAAGFAFRTVRDSGGNVLRSDLAGGQSFVHAAPADSSSTVKWGLKDSSGNIKTHINADGALVIQ